MTEAIAVHHTTGSYLGPPWAQFWKNIANYHVNGQGYRCIAYARGVVPDGTRFYLMNDNVMTPGVAKRNHRFIHVAFLGDHSLSSPTASAIEGMRQEIKEIREDYGKIPVFGHREVALPGHGTECPGDTFPSWLPLLA